MKGKIRDSNIELLRIVLSIFVIILHTNNPSDGGVIEFAKSIGYDAELFTLVFEVVTICAVNAFVIIAGYYLSITDKRNPWKVVELFLLCSLFTSLKYIVVQSVHGEPIIIGDVFFRLIPDNYYITLYSVLYLISPLINKAFIDSRQVVKKYTIGIVVLFSCIPTVLALISLLSGQSFNGLSTISNNGAQGGYTIVNFVMMYIVGLFLRKNDEKIISTPIWKFIILEIITFGLLVFWEHINIQIKDTIWGSVLNYYNILVVLEAVLFFCIFRKIRINSKIINELAKCSIVVYLFHGAFVLTIPYERIIQSYGIVKGMVFIVAISSGIYLCCYPIWKLYDLIIGRLFQRAFQKNNKKNVLSF